MKLIVGLGNPGKDYDNHRHNLGFWVVDFLAKKNKWRFEKSPTQVAFEAWGSLEGEDCFLIKPLTWMNHSGVAVKKVVEEKKAAMEDLIIIHDDLDLKLGTIRWGFDSSDGGHNGVRSVIEQLGTRAFYRLRLGIGRPLAHHDPAEYVLQPFAGGDLASAEVLTERAAQSVPDFLKHGLQWAQNKYH